MPHYTKDPLRYPAFFHQLRETILKGKVVSPPFPKEEAKNLRWRFYAFRRALIAQSPYETDDPIRRVVVRLLNAGEGLWRLEFSYQKPFDVSFEDCMVVPYEEGMALGSAPKPTPTPEPTNEELETMAQESLARILAQIDSERG